MGDVDAVDIAETKATNKWVDHLSDYEIQRLQFFQLSGRIQATAIEVLDFYTDLAFVATLYVFSQPGDPGDSFLGVLASTNNVFPDGNREFDFFKRLFVAAATIMVLNVVIRGLIALRRLQYAKYFDGPWDWMKYVFGFFVVQVEPHNGVLFIESIVKYDIPKISDYRATVLEIRMESLMLAIEDFPQFVIQCAFAVKVAKGDLTVTWYVSTLITCLKIFTTLGGIVALATKLSALKKLELREQVAVAP